MTSLGIVGGILHIFIVIVLVLQCVGVQTTLSNVKLCKHFLSADDGKLPTENVRESFSEKCPPSPAAFSVFNVHTEGEEEEITNLTTESQDISLPTLLLCWSRDVKRLALHFDSPVSIDDVQTTHVNVLKSCDTNNDTVYITRQTIVNDNMYQLLLHLPATTDHPYTFKAFYDHRRQVHIHGHHKVLRYRYKPVYWLHNQRVNSADPDETAPAGAVSSGSSLFTESKRRKRSTADDVKVHGVETCGKSRGCYRHGEADCEHFSCDYFLSYHIAANTVDLEMSARSDGWVAVGFSSDGMMGGDDLIVCSLLSGASTDVVAQTYKNPYSHDSPERKSNIVTLKKGVVKDGYIYCHVTCPGESTDRQDLTNNWFQLYARGSVTPSGGLEKHSVTPYVSSKRITMLVLENFHTSSASTLLVALTTLTVAPIFLGLFT